MSTQYLAILINLLTTFLPLVGITVESKALETTIQTLVAVGTGLWVLYQRNMLRKVEVGEASDVTPLGVRK